MVALMRLRAGRFRPQNRVDPDTVAGVTCLEGCWGESAG